MRKAAGDALRLKRILDDPLWRSALRRFFDLGDPVELISGVGFPHVDVRTDQRLLTTVPLVFAVYGPEEVHAEVSKAIGWLRGLVDYSEAGKAVQIESIGKARD